MKRTPDEQAQWLKKLPSHRLAFEDVNFLHRDELRPVRLQLELLKPELLQQEQGIVSTIVVFGSARVVEGDTYYDMARLFSRLVSEHCQARGIRKFVITTGGGPGIMEAANRGAHDVGAKSIGLNIQIPLEQMPNPYITPDLCFSFHYFALRKMHFLLRARALVIFPGGFGTLDELFDALTLIQTGKMDPMPIIMVGKDYWRRVLDFEFLVEHGKISAEDLEIVVYVDSAEDAWQAICSAYPAELD